MWSTAAVAPEDQLDRAAAKKVLRRSLALARPVRRDVLVSVALIAALHRCARWPGPTLVRYAIDHGLTPPTDIRAVNVAVVAYIAVTVVAYFLGRAQQLTINRAGEGFLPRPAGHARSATCCGSRCRSTTARRRASWCPA